MKVLKSSVQRAKKEELCIKLKKQHKFQNKLVHKQTKQNQNNKTKTTTQDEGDDLRRRVRII